MTTVLLTGFEPFAGATGNPSADVVRDVAASYVGPAQLVTAVLPVTFAGAAARIRELIREHSPDIVIATGLAGGTEAIKVERFALNLQDARIADNDGERPVDVPSVVGGPLAWETLLPVKAIAAAIRAAGIPAAVSLSAGSFVCNHVFATLSDALSTTEARGGFIHLPWSTETAPDDDAHLGRDRLAEAMQIVIDTAISRADDLEETAGALH